MLEVDRGFNMSWDSVPRITNLVGPAKAKRIVVLTEKLHAARATDYPMRCILTISIGEAPYESDKT